MAENTPTSHEILTEALNNERSSIDKAIELAVAVSLSAVVVPKGNEIDALSKLNPKTPVYFAILQEYEKRMNQLLGVCKATGLPLVPQMKWISGMIQNYMRVTPSTGKSSKNRAEMLLCETLKGGALQRQMDMGQMQMPGARVLEDPEERRSKRDKLLGRKKPD